MAAQYATTPSPAEALKKEGNEYFQKDQISEAIDAYSRGIRACSDQESILKSTIYSNRAACYLHQKTAATSNDGWAWESCIEDCTSGLTLLDHLLHFEDETTVHSIRDKLLYRRAKARFLSHCAQAESSSNDMVHPLLQDAAKDLLSLLSLEPHNKQAATLLNTIRAKHGVDNVQHTPVRRTLQKLMDTSIIDAVKREHDYKVLLGLVSNDPSSASTEIIRHPNAILFLWEEMSCSAMALQCLSAACQHGPFVAELSTAISQSQLADRMEETKANKSEDTFHVHMALLSLWLRLIQYLDGPEGGETQPRDSLVDVSCVVRTCMAALESSDPRLIQASIEIASTWTHPEESNLNIDRRHKVKTEEELRSMKPREVAAYQKAQYERSEQLKRWSKERALALCQSNRLWIWLLAATRCGSHGLRREIGIVLGRVLNCLEDDQVKTVVKPILKSSKATIEEVHNDYDEKLDERERLESSMKQGQLLSSLLLGVPDVGAWGVNETDGVLDELIESDDGVAMSIASEVVSAGASVEKVRSLISRLPLNLLLSSDDRDIQSGAASAVAKLGLSDKAVSSNEGEVMGLLQVAVELLVDSDESATDVKLQTTSGIPTTQAQATTAAERGIEVLSYLASKTQVKEELAHGFRANAESKIALERLVELASAPNAGESLSAYGLATIFALMAVSSQTLRREAFEGKDITMEQYDELQALSKTQEEKEMEPAEMDDPLPSVHERIQKMATRNVPTALVKLMDGATESTTEQVVIGMNRMAIEPSVRGLMVQQGVLSACLKVEKGDNPSEIGKKILKLARHCTAKLLISTNPALLTSSQRLGSIKPLIQLIKDNEASDLQQFEALLAVTNLASLDLETKDRIVAEKGISTLSYAMYSDHEMVRRAGTEAMVNLVGHPAMTKHLSSPETLRLWLAFASDYETNLECARAAAGCLAMSADEPDVAKTLVGLKSFEEMTMAMLESGNLELMHRVLVMLLNLVEQEGKCREAVIEAGLAAFCRAYVESYHDGRKLSEMNFSAAEQGQMSETIDIAKQIVLLTNTYQR